MFDKLSNQELNAHMRTKDPQMLARRYLHGIGLRYRQHNTRLPGKPETSARKIGKPWFIEPRVLVLRESQCQKATSLRFYY
jgi:G:T-mismatch repair DNA endonuclease (very short patch repair protein)